MIIKGGTIWGELRGKLSMTPEEAWELFGFRMVSGAKGVYFRVRRGKQEICNLFPPSEPRTDLQVRAMKRMGILSKVVKEIKGLIRGCWGRQALGRFSNGRELFISRNSGLVGLGLNWGKMIVTDGEVEVPVVRYMRNRWYKLFIWVRNFREGLFLGVSVFDVGREKFWWVGEFGYRDKVEVENKGWGLPFVVYLYFREGSSYSRSIGIWRV